MYVCICAVMYRNTVFIILSTTLSFMMMLFILISESVQDDIGHSAESGAVC